MPDPRPIRRTARFCLLILSAVSLFSAKAAECLPGFPTITSLKAGINPVAIAVGDFNNDQRPDIAVVNSSSEQPNSVHGTMTVFLNDGNRSFHTAGNYPLFGRPTSIAAGDLNHDGRLDLAVGGYDEALAVFYGEGNGNFKPRVDIGDRYGNSVALADFDGDNQPEALTTHDDGRIVIWKGFGDAIPTQQEYRNAGRPRWAQIGDFNGDGKLDFVASDFHNRKLVVMTGNGDATFEWKTDLAIDSEGGFVTCGDVDGDSKVDIVASSYGTNFWVFYGKGDATFENAVSFNTGPYQAGVVMADFDNNGTTDLASVGVFEGNLAFFSGNGNRQFAPPLTYTAGGKPAALAVADFDNDGNKDLAVVNQMPPLWQGGVSILWGKGGRFDAPRDVEIGFDPGTLEVIDANADGRPDLLSLDGLHFLSAIGQGGGNFQTGFSFPIGYQATGAQVTRDFDANGSLDIAVPTMSVTFPQPPPFPPPVPPSYNVMIFERNSLQEFWPTRGVTIFSRASGLVAGKFSPDNWLDIAVMLPFENKVSVFVSKSDRVFEPAINYSFANPPTQGLTADFDGDSRLDLVVLHQPGISILKGLGNGAFESPVLLTTNAWGSVVSGDFNGDGRPDLVTVNSSDHVALWINEGNGQFRVGDEYSTVATATKIVPADLNADGRLDLVVENSAGVSVLMGNGDGTLRPHSHHPVGEAPRSLVVADFTGDGRPDIAVGSGLLLRRLSLLENQCAPAESRLIFEKRQGQLWISWNVNEPGTLESASNLESPQWENVSADVAVEGDQVKISPPLGESARFFRLRRNP